MKPDTLNTVDQAEGREYGLSQWYETEELKFRGGLGESGRSYA